MEVFRLVRKEYAQSLSGLGAALKGARWNSMGVEMVYTAMNRSLAMAEVAVHFTLATLPSDYMMVTIHIPDHTSLKALTIEELPNDWNSFPHLLSTQSIGDRFVSEGKYCLLKIPSVVTRGDFNLLINPRHKEFSKIKIVSIEPFGFDNRIFK